MLADKQLQRVKNKGIIHGYFHHWLLHKHKSTERQITDDGSDGARRASSLVTHYARFSAHYSVFSGSVQVCSNFHRQAGFIDHVLPSAEV